MRQAQPRTMLKSRNGTTPFIAFRPQLKCHLHRLSLSDTLSYIAPPQLSPILWPWLIRSIIALDTPEFCYL